MTKLTSYSDVIMGNEEDANMYFGIKPKDIDVKTDGKNIKQESYKSVCEQLMKKFKKAKKVVITLRGSISASHNKWSGVLYDGKKLLKSNVKVYQAFNSEFAFSHLLIQVFVLYELEDFCFESCFLVNCYFVVHLDCSHCFASQPWRPTSLLPIS